MSQKILQLNPPIPLDTVKGPGYAILVIDYSQEHDLIWSVVLNASGEIWCIPNHQVRGPKNWSLGRTSNGLQEPLRKGKK